MQPDIIAEEYREKTPIQRMRDQIGAIFIRHDDIIRAWNVLDRTFRFGFRFNEAEPGYVYGDSRCGKTEVTHRWIKHVTGKRPVRRRPEQRDQPILCQRIEGNGVKIVYLDLTNGASPLEACKAVLKAFRYIKPLHRLKQAEATDLVIEMLSLHEIDALVVDETQQTFKGSGVHAADALGEWLIPMSNAKAFKLMLVGSRELEDLFLYVPAARARHGGVALLEPFRFKTEVDKGVYRAFVEQFMAGLPFKTTVLCQKGGTITERHLFDFYFTTRGVPGEHAKFFETVGICASERGMGRMPSALTKSDFVEAFDYLYRNDRLMKGVNPFKTDDLRDIQSIPLSPEEASAQRAAEEKPRKTIRKVGGRIHG